MERAELIRNAVHAASALVEDMAAEIERVDPKAATALRSGLEAGEWPVLAIDFAPAQPSLRLCLSSPGDQMRQVMVIEAVRPSRQ